MAEAESPTDFMQSGDHGELLDVIDLLRSRGISRYVPLPQIIVCGDQSSGKSSVLEAISEVPFPTKDKLCTLFATELILRRDPMARVKVAIIPSPERPSEEKHRLAAFTAPTTDVGEFPKLVDAAKEAMGLGPDAKTFSDDVLRVEVSGPKQPHLTLVDLPGLFHSESKQQSSDDKERVRELIQRYMESPRSVILAVISAQNEAVNQIVTSMARDVDRRGDRTLGIITKPDTLPRTSEREQDFVSIARNEDVFFRLGWHVLKNRDYEMRDCTLEERNRKEADFFSQGVWTSLPTTWLGIETLKPRLSAVLKDQILSELPSLIRDVRAGINDCTRRLTRLGAARGTPQEQRLYLTHIAQSFSSLTKAATDGTYIHDFFGDANSDVGYSRRLRAVVQNQLLDFAEDMRRWGHRRHIVEDGTKVKTAARPMQVARSEYIEHVRRLLKRSRGQELPGTFNPLIVGVLFYEQAQPWQKIVHDRCGELMVAVKATLAQILLHTTDETTRERLLREVINPAMDRHSKELDAKVSEVFRPHWKGHPITYNHYFTETIHRLQDERNERLLRERLNAFFSVPLQDSTASVHQRFNTGELLRALAPSRDADMDRYACSLAIDCMEAYYKVAMKVLVDDIAVLAMEYCLMDGLSEVFCPATVMEMDDSMVNSIATESHSSQIERARVIEKLQSLEAGLHTLNRLDQQKEMGGRALSMSSVRGAGSPGLKGGKSDPSEEIVLEKPFDVKGEDEGRAESLAKAPTSDNFDALVGGGSVPENQSPVAVFRTTSDDSWRDRPLGKRKSVVK